MTNPDNTEHTAHIDPATSLLDELLIREIMGPSRTIEAPIILDDPGCTANPASVPDFMASFTARFADQLKPTPDEWAMICEANAALTEKVKADEEEALRIQTEIIREENERLRAEALQSTEEDNDDQCIPGRAMTEDMKEEVLGMLLELWAKHPGLRLGQLILNAVPPTALYHMEDYSLIGKIALHYNAASGKSNEDQG